MPANGPYLIALTVAAIGLLLVLILAVRLHAFLALLLASMALGLAAGMGPGEDVLKSNQGGFGDALGFIAVVVGLGAMIGRFLEYSGGGRALADWLLEKFGRERAVWAMLITAFLVGLPIFFEVGFIILVPLVWNLARESKRSLLYYGPPMAAALTVTHSLVPPHPGPRRRNCSAPIWAKRFSMGPCATVHVVGASDRPTKFARSAPADRRQFSTSLLDESRPTNPSSRTAAPSIARVYAVFDRLPPVRNRIDPRRGPPVELLDRPHQHVERNTPAAQNAFLIRVHLRSSAANTLFPLAPASSLTATRTTRHAAPAPEGTRCTARSLQRSTIPRIARA